MRYNSNIWHLRLFQNKNLFFEKMLESVDSAKVVPEEFKEMMRKEAVTDERLVVFIDAQPRTLFDVFDENKIFICISVWTKTPGNYENISFGIALNATNKNNNNFSTRKEAELIAIEEAFEILEKQLTPIGFEKLDEAISND